VARSAGLGPSLRYSNSKEKGIQSAGNSRCKGKKEGCCKARRLGRGSVRKEKSFKLDFHDSGVSGHCAGEKSERLLLSKEQSFLWRNYGL